MKNVKQTAAEWGISERMVSHMCKTEQISGAVKMNGIWQIPDDAQKPADRRIVSGKYRKEHKKKAFFKSRNLRLPIVTKKIVKKPYDSTNQDVLYTSEYIARRPFFYNALNEFGSPEQVMDFQESTVHYTKIRK